MSGGGRSYSTTRCWETMPGMSVAHTGGSRGWRNTCRTASGDPRQATVITTISATDDSISFDETGQYQFLIQGQNCTASVRRTQSFRLLQREGEAPPPPKEPEPAPAPAPAPRPEPVKKPGVDCSDPGDPARLEVRPKKKLVQPGEEFTFAAVVLDEKGCRVGAAPQWRVTTDGAKARLSKPGTVRVEDDAPEGDIELGVTVAGRSVKVVLQVASKERYDALLAQGGFDERGESSEAAVAVIAGTSVGARAAVAEDLARSRRTTFLAVVGGLAAVLGIVGVALALRSRRRKRARGSELDLSPEPLPAPRTAMVCPTCREEYPPGSTFCPNDGNRLVPVSTADGRSPSGGICPVCGQGFDPGVERCPAHDEELVPASVYAPPRAEPQRKICPLCGKMYEGDSRFCGEDGGTLVPIN